MKRRIICAALALFVCAATFADTIMVRRGAAAPTYPEITMFLTWDDDTSLTYTMGSSDCSDGDTTGASGSGSPTILTSGCLYGANCLEIDGAAEWVTFASSSILSQSSGSMAVAVNLTTHNGAIVTETDLVNDGIGLIWFETDEVNGYWSNNGSADNCQTTTANVSSGWYWLIYRWNQSGGTTSTEVYDGSVGSWTLQQDRDCTGLTLPTLTLGSLTLGNATADSAADFIIDTFIVADEDFDYTEVFDETDAPASACDG